MLKSMKTGHGASCERALVAVVDDDESVRESLPDLLSEFGFDVRAFSSAEDFLESVGDGKTKCLVLDVALGGMSGLQLQQELKIRRSKIPIIFVTAKNDDEIRIRALQQGARGFLLKPFSDVELLNALNSVFETK